MAASPKTYAPAPLSAAELEQARRFITTEYPSPIAWAYARTFGRPEGPPMSHSVLQVPFQRAIRFLALLHLAEYRCHDAADTTVSRAVADLVGRAVDGKWLAVIRAVADFLAGAEGPTFIPEMKTAFCDRRGPREPYKALDFLVKARNTRLGHIEDEEDVAGDDLPIAALTRLLLALDWLSRYRLVAFDGDRPLTGEHDGSSLRGLGLPASGGQGSAWSLVLMPSTFDRGLRLSPLFMVRPCDRCSGPRVQRPPEVFGYERLEPRKAVYVGWRHRFQEKDESAVRVVRDIIGELMRRAPVRSSGDPVTSFLEYGAEATTGVLRHCQDSGKYLPDVFLPPPRFERLLRVYLEGDRPGFLLASPAGTGKTSVLCHTAQALLDDGHVVVLRDPGGLADPAVLVAPLGAAGDLARLRDVEQLVRFGVGARRAGGSGAKLVMILDGVNECGNPREIMAGAASLIRALGDQKLGRTLKVIIGVRDIALRDLEQEIAPSERFLFEIDDPRGGGTTRTSRISIEPFADHQIDELYELYRRRFRLLNESLDPSLRELFRNPLLLRLAAAAFAGRRMHRGLGETVIFASFLDRERLGTRVRRKETAVVDQLIRQAAARMFELGTRRLEYEYVFDVLLERLPPTEEDPYDRLLDEGIWMERRDLSAGLPRTMVEFTFEKCFEFLLGRRVLPARQWAIGLDGMLREVADRCASLPPVVGALRLFLRGELMEDRVATVKRGLDLAGDAGWRACGELLGELESSAAAGPGEQGTERRAAMRRADCVIECLAAASAAARARALKIAASNAFDTAEPERLVRLGFMLRDTCRELGWEKEEREALVWLGDVHYNREDDYEAAVSVLREAVEPRAVGGAEGGDAQDLRARTRYFLARVLADLGRRDEAEAHAAECWQHFSGREDDEGRRGHGYANFLLYMLHGDNSGRFRAALPYLEKAEDLFRGLGDERNLVRLQHNRAIALLFLATAEDAVRCAEQAIKDSRRLGDVQAVGYGNVNLAAVCLQSAGALDGERDRPLREGLIQKARDAIAAAREVYQSTREDYILTMCLANEAMAATLEGRREEAARLLKDVVRLSRESEDFFNEFDARTALVAELERNRFGLLDLLREAEGLRYQQGVLHVCWQLWRLCEEVGDREGVDEYRGRAERQAQELGWGVDPRTSLFMGFYAGLYL